MYDQTLFDKMLKEVPKKMRVITVYSLVEQFKINGSLARRCVLLALVEFGGLVVMSSLC